MLVVQANELIEGDLLGRGIYSSDGRLLLQQGVKLTNRLIDGIIRSGQHYIYINRADVNPVNVKTNLMNMTHALVTQIFQSVLNRTALPIQTILQWSNHITETIQHEPHLKMTYEDMIAPEEELVSHSVNVCILSLLTAKALGYSTVQLENLAIGSLLHDIGLVFPHDGTLLMNHPLAGYEMLKKYDDIPTDALRIVLQHHEQIDGRGFPHGLRSDQLLESSQICNLASDFDYFMNETSKERLPEEGINMIMSKVDISCCYAVVRAFIHIYEPYPNGTRVILTGGLFGEVGAQNKGSSTRPIIQLESNNTRLNLLEHTTLKIEKVLHTIL
ncbi:MAG: HD domain-containing protein [Candidatus Cohnella colombiensis]|uniref:HD domain-containing protein n=1 Tax=Candidatus Cohnella colombiensis TaxID=3121368 RepID=A0AA95JBE7_9BACL|nr:MAG: HD domain-containing protein [Cohnella sp.]